MMRRHAGRFDSGRLRTCRLVLALSWASAVAGAQPMALDGPPAPRVGALPGSPTARALEMIDKGDTTAAVDFLQASVKRQFKDASAWHLLGLLRWARIAEVRGQTYVRRLDQIKEIAAADSSLRIATQLAPDSARYWLSLARFNIRALRHHALRVAMERQERVHIGQGEWRSGFAGARIRSSRHDHVAALRSGRPTGLHHGEPVHLG